MLLQTKDSDESISKNSWLDNEVKRQVEAALVSTRAAQEAKLEV